MAVVVGAFFEPISEEGRDGLVTGTVDESFRRLPFNRFITQDHDDPWDIGRQLRSGENKS